MKTAIAQMRVSSHKRKNINQILSYILLAKKENADLVIFPEISMALLPNKGNRNQAKIAEPVDGNFVTKLSQAAIQYRIHIIFGIYEKTKETDKKFYNTLIFLNDKGHIIHKYRKTHLYDAFSYKESLNIIPGNNKIIPIKTSLGTIGLMICYELRFPEISRTLALQGAEILVIPAAWVSGVMKEEHLLLLSQARALENTVFVCIANQVGNIYTGRSVIYDPMGVILASKGEDEGLIFANIDLKRLEEIRAKLPTLKQRRPELYTF
ncbi:MAG: putative hydrolase [Candidatus Tokpelaia sp. JSC161]|jgi:predicted amidohydrolase|nr:MAG: putative hydrolase [Candidatus Tokpelaia sp. JSC161]